MRRFAAMLGMVLFLALVTTLVWRVYEHHQNTRYDDENTSSVTLPV